MRKIILIICILLILPNFVFAQEAEQVFKAEVLEVLAEKTLEREDGSTVLQQNIRLTGLDGEFKDQDFIINGVSDIDVFKSVTVKKGDKVFVARAVDFEGNEKFYLTDYERTGWLYFLAFLFALLIVLVGKRRGLLALLSLILTFLVIMKFVIPLILAGYSAMLVSISGALIILGLVIYVTWGFKLKAHIAVISIFISLFITGLISIIFSKLTHLTGLASEDALFLINPNSPPIDLSGLLLAGIIIGTLGVLDDVVISQISAVEQLKAANPKLKGKELYKKAIHIGIDHISSMTNTLFLAYAGAALPLLLLFGQGGAQQVGFTAVINNELISTEIVRTLTGSIGLILAVPISTVLATRWLVKKHNK